MKASISRTDNSVLGQWWWTVDHYLLGALFVLFGIGMVLSFSATPPVTERLKLDTYFLIKNQALFLSVAIFVMLAVSMQSPKNIRILSLLCLLGSFILLVFVLTNGVTIKGATRWIRIMGVSIQPSEFAKPAFAVAVGWLLSLGKIYKKLNGLTISSLLFLILACFLIAQPDFGMTLTVCVIFGVELFLSGIPMAVVYALIFCGSVGIVSCYYLLPHVQSRIDRFINPQIGDTYQVRTALEAFKNGGLFGTGPGEGRIKDILPDAHTDFVLAVAGEEYGLIACILIVSLFGLIVLRGFFLVFLNKNQFTLLAVSGLLAQFGMQALVNIGSTLSLIPTKGMTLPFISYGGSSLVSLGFGMGMVLALTRKTRTKHYE